MEGREQALNEVRWTLTGRDQFGAQVFDGPMLEPGELVVAAPAEALENALARLEEETRRADILQRELDVERVRCTCPVGLCSVADARCPRHGSQARHTITGDEVHRTSAAHTVPTLEIFPYGAPLDETQAARKAAVQLLWDKRGMLPESSEEIVDDVLAVALPFFRFYPLGDNHHRADACPYCSSGSRS